MKEELILKYWEGVSECNCDSPHPIGSCLKCDMQNLIMSESRKKHPLTTKEEAVKQVAEFDKVQPINKAWREMRDVDAIVEERDALLSENERLNNIIIELDRIIDLNEQQLCAEERDALKAKVESIEKAMLNDDDLDIFTVWDELERILEL